MSASNQVPSVLIVEPRAELARLMAAAVEMAGLRAVRAGLAQEARRLIEDDPPDVLMLELLLPDGFGYEVARSLRKTRPGALIMALSEAFAEDPSVRGALESGLLDEFFKKPFRIGRVVAWLEERIEWERDEAADPKLGRGGDPARELAEGSLEGSSGDFFFDAPEGGLIAAALSATEADALGEWVGEAPPACRDGFGSAGACTGDLSERSLPKIINAFYLGGQSGELILRRGRVVKMVYFHNGSPAFAASNLREDRFDVRLSATGEIDEDALREAIDEAASSGRRIDRVLLERGLISSARHRTLVSEQVKAILFSLFPWKEGVWQTTFHDRAELEPVRLEINPADLVLEGAASLSLEALEELLSRETCLAPSPTPPYELYQLSLSGPQAMVVARLDGTRPVGELAEEGWLSEQETYALLYGLLCLEVVEDSSLLLL